MTIFMEKELNAWNAFTVAIIYSLYQLVKIHSKENWYITAELKAHKKCQQNVLAHKMHVARITAFAEM